MVHKKEIAVKKNQRLHVDPGNVTQSTKTRISAAQVLEGLVPNNPFIKSQPALQNTSAAVIQAGDALATAETDVDVLEAQLATARQIRDSKQVAFDQVHTVFLGTLEQFAQTPADIASVQYTVRQRITHPVVTPLGITTGYDPKKQTIEIHVRRGSGNHKCVIEISPDPIVPGTWKRLAANAAKQSVPGYAPGLYWIRAAISTGKGQSDFTAPVSVTVK